MKQKGIINPVFIVGTGPGDPELLTMRAERLIREADVILYDCRAVEAVLGRASAKATIVNVDRAAVKQDLTFEENSPMLEAIREHYLKGLKVVRLKAGDPTLFGGADECDALDREGIPYQVVPGISAGSAAAAGYAMPISRKGESCVVVNLIADDLDEDALPLRQAAALLCQGFTMTLYMAKTKLAVISRILEQEGVSGHLPVVAVTGAGRPHERMAESTIGTMCTDERFMSLDEPVVYMLGRHVRVRMVRADSSTLSPLFANCGKA
ncbi:MAG: uroporphyrinogen-III C-methyltransferase [Chlorobiaceae bacterium]|nr:uroporphyrinogen-III C-methyltransferase [Chlorobiaceae bacterium]